MINLKIGLYDIHLITCIECLSYVGDKITYPSLPRIGDTLVFKKNKYKVVDVIWNLSLLDWFVQILLKNQGEVP